MLACRCFRIQDRSSVGVHSSMGELTILAVSLSSSLHPDKPTVLAWLSFVVTLAMYELANVPYSLWE